MRDMTIQCNYSSWFEKPVKHGGTQRNVNVDYITHDIREVFTCLGMITILWLICRTCVMKYLGTSIMSETKLQIFQSKHTNIHTHAPKQRKYNRILTVQYRRW